MLVTAPVSIVDSLMDAAFHEARQARSAEYKEGARAALEAKVSGARVHSPYRSGTAQCDAFYSGVNEGNQLWRAHLAAEDRRLAISDRAALEIGHRQLCTTTSLDDMLKNPALSKVVQTMARKHLQRRGGFDPKKLQANDND
jgi:hypothetical protein